jgi:beta-xylosidase
MMETTDPASNKWEDKGYVICSSSDKSKTSYARTSTSDWNAYFRWNAIDPSFIITPTGQHWLVYGSWHSGECAIQLDPETGKLLNKVGEPWNIGTGTTTRYGKRVNTRLAASRWQGSEAPEVIYNPTTGYYYMFLAYDELSVAYNTRVCRSKNIDGPYYSMDGTNVSDNGGQCYPVVTHPYKFSSTKDVDGWVGISHCAIFDDGQGNYYYCSQARLPKNYNGNAYSNAIMMGHVRSIRWTPSDWPVVMPERYAAVPQAVITKDSLVGSWENIDLSYSAGVQKTSSALTLGADGTLSGALSGTWSYDEAKQNLTFNVASKVFTLCVQRELDWEAYPRVPTIVYAGYSADGKTTYWGKKSK